MPYPYKKRGKMPRLENIYGLFIITVKSR